MGAMALVVYAVENYGVILLHCTHRLACRRVGCDASVRLRGGTARMRPTADDARAVRNQRPETPATITCPQTRILPSSCQGQD
jgi:hypothetical protein